MRDVLLHEGLAPSSLSTFSSPSTATSTTAALRTSTISNGHSMSSSLSSSLVIPPGPNFLHMLPLLVLVLLPVAYGIFGVRRARLRSPIHFQQGTLGTSPWRAALSMCFIAIPPFTLWNLLISSASSLFFLFGLFAALLLVILTTSNILHYIPSPSVYTYIDLRFHSRALRKAMSFIQLLVSIGTSLILLHFTAAALSTLTSLPISAIAPLLGFSTLFAIMFSGQSNVMTPVLVVTFVFISFGLGLFIYFSVEDVVSLQALLPLRFGIPESGFSFVIGFMLTLYQLTASPAVYQLYFSLSTRHKLRLCFILYGVFMIVASSFVFLLCSLFTDFLAHHCKLSYSLSSLFQFVRFTLHPHSLLSYTVCTAFFLLPLTVLQSLLLSSTGHIWEEWARKRFVGLSAGKQLATVQALSFLLCSLLVAIVVVFDYFHVPLHIVVPIAFYTLCVLACILASAFLVGHYLPFGNSKGTFVALTVSILIMILLLSLRLTANEPTQLQVQCAEAVVNATGKAVLKRPPMVSIELFGPLFSRAATGLAHLPLYSHPFIVTLVYIVVAAAVSWATGGEDLFVLDWNLVVYVCSPFSPPLGKRRSFVESESFRYAQQKNNVRYPAERTFLYA